MEITFLLHKIFIAYIAYYSYREALENMRSQKVLTLVLVISLVFSVFGISLGSSRSVSSSMDNMKTDPLTVSFAGGSGTEADPYQISNVTQLQNINKDLSAHYEMVNDIDASATIEWNDGNGFEPIGGFRNGFYGTLDGQGHNITDLYINRPSGSFIGLFGRLAGNASTGDIGSVSDIGLEDADITGDYYVGGLVGENEDGKIKNCYVTGNVNGGIDEATGGLVGYNAGMIRNSFTTCTVNGSLFIGGLVGYNNRDGNVTNSYATGAVSGGTCVGGLLGGNGGLIRKSYAVGKVSGDSDLGGLVGEAYNDTVKDSFWDTQESGQDNSESGTGKTTAEMKDVSTFTDTSTEGLHSPWDFIGDPNDDSSSSDYWNINSSNQINDGYPYLSGRQTDGTDQDTIPPTADAGEDKTVDVNENFTLNASGSSDNEDITGYSWKFGDGSTSSGMTVTHSYSFAGTYTVTLTVSDAAGNTDEDTINITVEGEQKDRESPEAVLKADNKTVHIGESIDFDASRSSDNVEINSYSWKFGDGSTGSGETAAHSYYSTGNYTVILNVSDAAGNWDVDQCIVNVTEIEHTPVADGEWYNGTGNINGTGYQLEVSITLRITGNRWNNITFILTEDGNKIINDTLEREAGNPNEKTWDVNINVSRVYEMELIYMSQGAGANPVSLTVEYDNNSYKEYYTFNSDEGEEERLTLKLNSFLENMGFVVFDGSGSHDQDGNIERYHWNFGDGSYGDGEIVHHTYSQNGTYDVTLTVTDNTGRSDTDNFTVFVDMKDTDGDGIPDGIDKDDDNDGIPDRWEYEYGLNPKDLSGSAQDSYGDGSTDLQEDNDGFNPLSESGQQNLGISFWIFVVLGVIGAIITLVFWKKKKIPFLRRG